jgi:molybdopterin converting factor small subunit
MSGAVVRFFGPLSDAAGTDRASFSPAVPLSVGELRSRLIAVYPGLDGETFRVAVDGRMCGDTDRIETAREIALLPPFAGG